jgi:hypothetical protein
MFCFFNIGARWGWAANSTLRPVYFLTQYCAGGQIEKNEMGRTCGAYGGGKRGARGVGGET